MKKPLFFSKFISDLKSKYEAHFHYGPDAIEISWPAISLDEIKTHWFMILFLFFFCAFGIIGSLESFARSEMRQEQMYHLFVLLFFAGLLFFVFRFMIRPLFVTEKLTMRQDEIIHSRGISGNFKV